MAKGQARNTSEESLFHCFNLWSHSFGHYPEVVTIDEDREADWQQLCFYPQLFFSPKQTRRRTRLLQTRPQSVNFLFHSFLTWGSNLFQTLILRTPKQNTASWLHLKILPMKIMKRIRDKGSPLRTCPTHWRQCGPSAWNYFWTLLSNTFTTKHLLLTLSVILERSNKYMLNNQHDFTTISKSK